MCDSRPDARVKEGRELAPEAESPFFGILWAIKPSFVEYVMVLNDGRVSTHRGAAQVQDGFCFTFDPDTSIPDERLVFRGDLVFEGHGGALHLDLSDPELHIRRDYALLTFRTSVSSSERTNFARMKITPEGRSHGRMVFRGYDIILEASATPFFNGVYPPYEPLEDLLVVLPTASPTV